MNDRHITFSFVILLTAIVFGLDLLAPDNFVSARFYVIPMLLAGLALSVRQTTFTTASALALTLFSIIYSRQLNIDYMLLLGLIAVIGVLSIFLSRTIGRLRQRTEEAEQAKETLSILNEASRVASSTLNPGEIISSLINLSLNFLAADSVHVKLDSIYDSVLAGEDDCLYAVAGDNALAQIKIQESAPAIKARDQQIPISIPDMSTEGSYCDEAFKAAVAEGSRGAVFFPLLSKAGPKGVLTATWKKSRAITAEEATFIAILAAQTIEALENVRLYTASKSANARLRTLFSLGNDIASRQDIDQIIDSVTSAVQELLSPAHASLMLAGELSGELEMRGHQDLTRLHPVPEHTDTCQKLALRAFNSGARADGGTAEPVHAFNVSCSKHCRFARMATEGNYHSVLSVPVTQNNKVLGVLSSFRIHEEKKEDPYSEEDKSLLEAIASLAAIAISNAEALERQKTIAHALQSNLLPLATPSIPGLSIGTFYASATTDASIGGDFYDFIAMPDGRFAICIGDVCGKGIDAASDTAMTKYMLRMIAAEDESPSRTLERLNIALYNNLRPGRFVTVFFGIYDPKDCSFIYSSAGHHSPIHIRDGAEIDFELEQGVALGIVPFTTYSEHKQTFMGNDVVALFTDGLIEARQGDDLLGSERVALALGGHTGKSASGMAAALPDFAMKFSGGSLADDLAVVILQRTLTEADIITSAVK